jgi:hypothetical protein
MKKQVLIILVLLVGFAMPALAQKQVEARMQLARDRYSAGLENIAINKQYEADEIPAVGYTTVVRKQNWAGSGQMIEKLEFYYNEIEEDMEPYPVGYELVIVRRTYNISAREYFEEYVYDKKGKPLFWFATYDDNGKVELRGYFGENGDMIRAICKKADDTGKMKECGLDDDMEQVFMGVPDNFIAFNAAFQAIYSVAH